MREIEWTREMQCESWSSRLVFSSTWIFFFSSSIETLGGIGGSLKSGKSIKGEQAGKMADGVNEVRSLKLRICRV